MKSLIIASLLIMSLNAQANEESSMVVGIIVGGTTYAAGGAVLFVVGATVAGPIFTTLELSGNGFKIVIDAKEDAAAFVASEGAIRTAALEQALQIIRNAMPSDVRTSDLQIAEAILAL
ncbi:hypothetical protein D3C72_1116780 [compost metagenome]